MKKSFYCLIASCIFLAFAVSSCQKETVKPTPTAKEQGASSQTSSSGDQTSSETPPYSSANHPTCPASGEHH